MPFDRRYILPRRAGMAASFGRASSGQRCYVFFVAPFAARCGISLEWVQDFRFIALERSS